MKAYSNAEFSPVEAVPRIGNVLLGGIPRVVFAVGSYAPALKDARASGISILEARLDLFERPGPDFALEELGRLKALGLPLLATFRPKPEGGAWEGDEQIRKQVLLASLPLVDALDVELSADGINGEIAQACRAAKKTLLVSSHCLDETPSDAILNGRFDAAKKLGAHIVKLACLARTPDDVRRLLNLVAERRDEGIVGISMGTLGTLSRVAAPFFGSLLTYAGQSLNYGQLPVAELVQMLAALYPKFREDGRV